MTVLAAIDFSERSLRILPHAVALSRALGKSVTAVHVMDPEGVRAGGRRPRHEVVGAARAEREGELSDVLQRKVFGGRGIVVVREAGESVQDALLRIAAELKASVIAIGSRGSGAVRHALLGSVAMGVLKGSDVPVLCAGSKVRRQPRPGQYHFAITHDGSSAADSALLAVAPMLKTGSVEATLIRVYVPVVGDRGEAIELITSKAELEAVRRRLFEGLEVGTYVEECGARQGAAAAIIAIAETVGATVIAMSTHGHSAKRHLLMGSVALGVLGRSPLPVMLVRSGAGEAI